MGENLDWLVVKLRPVMGETLDWLVVKLRPVMGETLVWLVVKLRPRDGRDPRLTGRKTKAPWWKRTSTDWSWNWSPGTGEKFTWLAVEPGPFGGGEPHMIGHVKWENITRVVVELGPFDGRRHRMTGCWTGILWRERTSQDWSLNWGHLRMMSLSCWNVWLAGGGVNKHDTATYPPGQQRCLQCCVVPVTPNVSRRSIWINRDYQNNGI